MANEESARVALELAEAMANLAEGLNLQDKAAFLKGFVRGVTNSLVIKPSNPTSKWEYELGHDLGNKLRTRPGHEIG